MGVYGVKRSIGFMGFIGFPGFRTAGVPGRTRGDYGFQAWAHKNERTRFGKVS